MTAAPDTASFNFYGPTESTVTLQHFLEHTTPLPRFAVPVGYPVGGTEILLLGTDGEPSQLFGEIVIRSAHVALGYWRQESTAFGNEKLPQPRGVYQRRHRKVARARRLGWNVSIQQGTPGM